MRWLLLAVLLLCGCASTGLQKEVDEEHGVVCYMYRNSVSCVAVEMDEDDYYERAEVEV